MSYVTTYDKKLPKPKGIGFAIGVHAVVIGAVIAMPGVTFNPVDKGDIDVFNIPKPAPPEPIKEKQKPEVEIPRENFIKSPKTPIDALPQAPNPTRTEFAGGEELILGGGSGEGIDIPFDPIEAIKPTPDPVIVNAQLNSRYASQFQPRYPSGLLRLDEEGVVSVRVLVGTNGRAIDVQLISSPHQDFWIATRKHALKKWRFKPATKDGKAVEGWITLKVRFEINA